MNLLFQSVATKICSQVNPFSYYVTSNIKAFHSINRFLPFKFIRVLAVVKTIVTAFSKNFRKHRTVKT